MPDVPQTIYTQLDQTSRQPLPFEQALSAQLYAMNYEKTFLDKPLAKEDVQKISDLMKKPHMSKEELTSVYHYVSTIEIKLLNFEEQDKFVLTKCIIFMNNLFQIAIDIYDLYDKEVEKSPRNDAEKLTQQLWQKNRDIAEGNIRALLTMYLYMARCTLSLEGVGFDKVITNRFEYVYPSQGAVVEEKRGLLDRIPFIGGRK